MILGKVSFWRRLDFNPFFEVTAIGKMLQSICSTLIKRTSIKRFLFLSVN